MTRTAPHAPHASSETKIDLSDLAGFSPEKTIVDRFVAEMSEEERLRCILDHDVFSRAGAIDQCLLREKAETLHRQIDVGLGVTHFMKEIFHACHRHRSLRILAMEHPCADGRAVEGSATPDPAEAADRVRRAVARFASSRSDGAWQDLVVAALTAAEHLEDMAKRDQPEPDGEDGASLNMTP